MKIFNKGKWKKVKLGDVCDKVISGEWGTEVDENSQNTAFIIRTTNFSNNGKIDIENKELVKRKIDEIKIKEKSLKKGDIIIEKSGGSSNQPVGRVVYFNLDTNDIFLCNNFTSILRINEKINSKYIFYFLRNSYKNNKVIKYQNKTTGIINLKLKDYLKENYLFLPKLEIQNKIVNILDNLEILLEKNQKYLIYLKELNKSLFRFQFFSSGKNFQKKKLKDNIIEMFIGPFGSDLKNEIFVDKEKGYCMVYEQRHAIKRLIDNDVRYITKEKYESLKRFKVEGGDIIVSCRGTIGKIYALPNDAEFGIIHSSLMKIKLKKDKYNNTFFEKLLEKYMQENIYSTQGSSIKMTITAKKLSKEYFIIPPIELQNKFAERIEKIEKLSFEIENSIKEAENLYNSLMNKYFE